jgi:CHAT domain-containing protein
LPPFSRYGQTPFMWLSRAVRMLSVLFLWHSGPLGAAQAQQSPSVVKQIDATMAEGRKLRGAGRFAEAIEKFTSAAHAAHEIEDADREAIALRESSACHVFLFHYRDALALAQTAQILAIRAKDNTEAGADAMIECTIYRGLGDLPLAGKESQEAIRLLADTPRRDFYSKALVNQAILEMQEGRSAQASEWANRAVEAAHQANLGRDEGFAWDIAGLVFLENKQLPEAEKAFHKAVAIRTDLKDNDSLAVTHEHLAELELGRHNYVGALKWIDQAFAAHSPAFQVNAQYYPVHVRAEILLGLGRTHDALTEFRRAVELASDWRSEALPGDVTSTLTVAQLHEVYEDYAELAATIALRTHDSGLARSGLEVLAENRAASLREQLTLSYDQNLRLPPEYFELVSELQKQQARVTLGEKSQEHEAKLREIRLRLSDLENKIGLKVLNVASQREKNPHKNSLRSIQTRLSTSEVLLSFCLGKQRSFVWAVTGDDVSLYELPDETTIGQQAKAFTIAARMGQDTGGPGRVLSQTLFGQLSAAVRQKRDWLLTGDGALLEGVPFSALPAPAGENGFLSPARSLRLVPSELLLLQPKASAPAPLFVGVADPVYNLADSRRTAGLALVPAKHTGSVTSLARLVSSDREVRTAARMSGVPDTELLTGLHASGDALRQAAAKRPELVHFAVHVVSPDARPQEAALALSLTSDSVPELLTPEAIASYRVPGSLVVMSGCDSEQGKAVPSAGLIGLSRAWLLAGAVAVVVSAWPTPDDAGQFFSAFYSHLQKQTGPLAKRASIALKEAQSDMQRGGGYRSLPSLWAAYSIISKE